MSPSGGRKPGRWYLDQAGDLWGWDKVVPQGTWGFVDPFVGPWGGEAAVTKYHAWRG